MTTEHAEQRQTPALKTWIPPVIEDVSLRAHTRAKSSNTGEFSITLKNGS